MVKNILVSLQILLGASIGSIGRTQRHLCLGFVPQSSIHWKRSNWHVPVPVSNRKRCDNEALCAEARKPMDVLNGEGKKTTTNEGDDTTNRLWDLREIRANILREEKKEIPTVSTFQLVAFLLVGIPVWIVVLVPTAIASTILTKLASAFSVGASASSQPDDDTNHKETTVFPPFLSEMVPRNDRKYDLVYLGATGFTGKLAIEYLVRTYGVGGKVKWAIAGRSRDRLNEVMAAVAEKLQIQEALEVDTIIVDCNDRSTLHDLVSDTRTVATSAGPFYLYGSNVVEFCSKYGTNYVDITGEVDWHKDMIMKWDDTAQKTGAKIVSFCGCDSLPFDLSLFKLRQLLWSECDNEELIEATNLVDGVFAGPSGGTLATMMLNLDGKVKSQTKYPFNPLLRKMDGSKSDYVLEGGPNSLLPRRCNVGVETMASKWQSPFVMTAINAEVVKRSYALQSKGNKRATYRESLIFDDFKTCVTNFLSLPIGITLMMTPLRSWFIPKPGEGPSSDLMEKGHVSVFGFGTGSKGNTVESLFYFPKDIGYLDTARMLVESGLCLSLDHDTLPVQSGGFYTTSTAMGDPLLQRLCRTGCQYFSRVVPQGKQN